MRKNTLQTIQPSLDLIGQHARLTPSRVQLLLALQEQGSISAAARATGMSYKGAWDAVAAMNTLADHPLVETELGGVGGGGAQLTPTGCRVLAFYQALDALQQRVLAGADLGDLDRLPQRINNLMLRTSARNQYEGVITAVKRSAVTSQISLRLDGGDTLVASITNGSVEELGLVVGGSATALIKASFVTLVADDAAMPSTVNHLRGVVANVRRGATHAEVELRLAADQRLIATVSNDSVDQFGVAAGVTLGAVIEASHVILAVAV